MQNTTQIDRRAERFSNKSAFIASKYLRKAEELSGLPDAMHPFLNVLRKMHVDLEAPYDNTKPVIGTYCMMVPQELIYAAGAENVKLCSGSFTAFSIGEDTTPRDACPLVKAVVGCLLYTSPSPRD